MRVTVGILMIIGGLIGSVQFIGNLTIMGLIAPLNVAVIIRLILGLFLGILTIWGAICTLMRKYWRFGLVGGICAVLIGFFTNLILFIIGVLALIFLIKSKGKFQ